MHRWTYRSCAIAALTTSVVLPAQPVTQLVELSAQIFVEQRQDNANGGRRLVLTQVQKVSSGDRLVFVVRYRNEGTRSVANYVVTNPLPATVRLDAAGVGGLELSADGGRIWGKPGSLMATGADGRLHPATLDEVTHIRWVAPVPIAPGAAGQISYRGIVR